MIPYARQDINQADIDAVVEVLRSDYLTQGPVVPAFENIVSDYCNAKYAVSTNSATSALHMACLALGVGKGDVVWTTPITFVASANCALYCGASVDFVDIDRQTYNLSVDRLAEKLARAKRAGNLPKLVIPVHFCGQPSDMADIHALSQKYGFKIIEDASHAIGARYENEPIGNCRYSDITVFSFHPVKIITSGEGGMALTNDAGLEKKLRHLRSHGITSDATEMDFRAPEELWNYQQIGLGFNYRMTDIHAALGVSQMARLDEFVAQRHNIAKRYEQMLSNFPVFPQCKNSSAYSAYHLFVIRLNLDVFRGTNRLMFQVLRDAGVGVNMHYIPVYRHPYYEKLGFRKGTCPEAEQYFLEAISLPMYPGLTEVDQSRVVDALKSALSTYAT